MPYNEDILLAKHLHEIMSYLLYILWHQQEYRQQIVHNLVWRSRPSQEEEGPARVCYARLYITMLYTKKHLMLASTRCPNLLQKAD